MHVYKNWQLGGAKSCYELERFCLHQNLERKTRKLEASKIVSIKVSVAWRLILADSEETLESALFEWRQQVTIMGYGRRREMQIRLYKKGKIRV